MKKSILFGAFALMNLCLGTLTSCSKDNKDDDKTPISIKLEEVGEDNSRKGTIGRDLHIEGDVLASARIKQIQVDLRAADGAIAVSKIYDSSKYQGNINAKFHEHLDLPSTLTPGAYKVVFTVTDLKGNTKSVTTDITLMAIDPNAPKVTNLVVNGGTLTAKAGTTINISAKVTVTSAVKEIEVEFHGNKKFSIDLDSYKGKTGTFDVNATITIPADAQAGKYHVHFEVEDVKGLEGLDEVKGFTITR